MGRRSVNWAGTIYEAKPIRYALHGERFIGVAEPFVWAIAKCMVRALFLAGHETVILDATNTTKKRRDEWLIDEWECRYHVIATTVETCLARADANGDDYIKPIIQKMAAQFEPLRADPPHPETPDE